jgi:DNA invertase Pin-like site-specific DNA recombinase
LDKALALAKENDCTLIIAKLDRLSRNASFIMKLKDSGVDFTACDMPQANTLTIGIMALLAQQELELISKRTKDALKALKARGVKLGNPNPDNLMNEHGKTARANSLRTRQENAKNDQSQIQARELATLYREKGYTLQKIADQLTEKKFTTRRNKAFSPKAVSRLIKALSQ